MTDPRDEPELPASVQTEITVLGAMLLDQQAVRQATSALVPSDFSLNSHQRIFRVMAEMAADGRPVDLITVMDALIKKHELDAIGGASYLSFLTEGIPRNPNVESYIRLVKDKSLLRQLYGVFTSAAAAAADPVDDASSILQDVKQRLAELSTTTFRSNGDRKVLIGATDFLKDSPAETEWAVEGLIQRGGNGIVVGDPGSAKSFSTLDLAHHLVAGVEWMAHAIPKRMKVAYIAREDHAGLTQQRALSLLKGYEGKAMGWALGEVDLNEWLYFNTRAQSETFSLQNEMDVVEMIDAFKANGIEMAFFDVFRRLWEGDENDNKEVAKVLGVLTRIQTECGCSVALVHHLNKSEGGTIFQRIRGAGSIYGWREWAFGISIENPEDDPKDRIRKIVFETKAATPASPVYYSFDSYHEDQVTLSPCNPPAPSYKGHGRKKAAKDEPEQQGWWEK
jgi:hypothetical protein